MFYAKSENFSIYGSVDITFMQFYSTFLFGLWPSLITTQHNEPSICLFLSLHQWTPLHLAAGKGHKDTVLYLVQKEAEINIKDGYSVSECTSCVMITH